MVIMPWCLSPAHQAGTEFDHRTLLNRSLEKSLSPEIQMLLCKLLARTTQGTAIGDMDSWIHRAIDVIRASSPG